MLLTKAVVLFLSELNQPVVTDYELYVLLYKLVRERKFRGESLDIGFTTLDNHNVENIITENQKLGILVPHTDFPPGRVYEIIGKTHFDTFDTICSVDPFAYISHLSAMAFHGLTDRISTTIFISTPPPKKWSQFAAEKMKKDLGRSLRKYSSLTFPKLTRIRFEKVKRRPIVRYSSIHHGAFKSIKGRKLRVSTVGRTFLDMVREPGNCGGMRHVIEVYSKLAKEYKDLIINEVSRHGKKIEKSRVGYLLEERCGIKDERILDWLPNAQRGGSRKLDPHEEYSNEYSERWCISLNAY
jgi:predicted transcriptional regulator of viral defense system